jgi:hypothetical protein
MNKTFDTCPRCNIHASLGTKMVICQCGMGYLPGEEYEYSLAIRNFLGEDGHHLGWDLKTKQCFYGTLEQFVCGQGVHLPWLPFTITPQQLTDILSKPVMIHHLTPQEAAGINEIDEEGSKVLNDILSENE